MGGKRLVNSRIIGLATLVLGLVAAVISPTSAESRNGRIAGVVLDVAGVPQMGATVIITTESLLAADPIQLLTNEHGRFAATALSPGLYSVRVTLAGFLPTVAPNVQVSSSRTTSVEIELGSMLTGLADLRRRPSQRPDDGEWGWVLRSAQSTRPILRWHGDNILLASGGESSSAENPQRDRQPRSRVDITSGVRPGSATSFSDSPATSFAYDEGVGATGQFLIAGQLSYESDTSNGGFATVWLPEGNEKSGPMTSLVVRQSRLGPVGPVFRGLRLDQDGVLALTSDVTLRYGAEYLLTGLGSDTTSGLRPRAEVAVKLAKGWEASAVVASRPWPETSPEATAPLESALESIDAFPTMLFRNDRPVLENGWHEEIAVEHIFEHHSRVMLAGFHDRSEDTAVFGQGGPVSGNSNFLQDFFSNGFAYDAGTSGSWGMRAAYQQKFSKEFETALVYAWAGALSPVGNPSANEDLRAMLATTYHSSVAGSVSSKLPVIGTQLTTGYKWIDGTVVSRQDEYGEALFQLDPYFNLVIRQPIPCMHHMEAVADFGNLLAQGYVPMTTRDGNLVMVAAYRTFRGGLSLQF
ncbi:MAG: carboxypeptidase-like regulatory domain-containing protein [Candidatus Acidiferrales bacterium]